MRPDWNITFMKTAQLVAEHSTCIKTKVGAVLVKDKRILCIGYNGTISNENHCNELFEDYNLDSDEFKEVHYKWSKYNEIHSELNILLFSAKNGINVNGTTIYTTMSPCRHCSLSLISAGVKELYYNELYDKELDSLSLWKERGLLVQQIEV